MASAVTPTGFEQSPKTLGKTASGPLAVSPAVSLMSERDEQTAEMLSTWATLDATERAEVLAVARDLSSRHPA